MKTTLASNEHALHQPGDVIASRYTLRSKLGEGAMGVVWVAHCRALDVDVALKMLRPELGGTPAVERMAREARSAAQLGHPALVRVLDFGSSDRGEPFVAMELLEGEELNARLARDQRIPAVEAVGLLLPIVEGLGMAHEKGIVHRDVKPENIYIAVDQLGRIQPKVLDFGVAKLGGEAISNITDGAVVGSPYYLSPEQAEGLDDIDQRCDVWAVGVVLYECITGSPPFTAANYNVLLQSIKNDRVLPLPGDDPAQAALWLVLDRCLQKDREQRWASMWELGEALALWLFERGVRVDAAARSLRHGWLESGVTGVQILVPSDVPEPLPRRAAAKRRPGPVPARLEADPLVPTNKAFVLAEATPTETPAPSRRWWWAAIALALVACLAAVVSQASWSEPSAAPLVEPAAAKAAPSALAPLGLGAMEQPTPPSMMPRAEPLPSATPQAATSAAPSVTSKPKRAAPKRAPLKPKRPEFGF